MHFGDRIKQLRKQHNMSQQDLATNLKLSRRAIGYYESNERFPKDEEMIKKIATIFGVSINYLFDFDINVDISDKMPQGSMTKIPVLGNIRAGEPMFAEQNITEYRSADLSLIPKASIEDLFYLKIKGNSMNLSGMPEGTYILVKKQERVENGEIGVVLVDGNEATVKKVYCEGSFVTLFPNSSDPSFEPLMIDTTKEFVQVVGKVVGSWTQY